MSNVVWLGANTLGYPDGGGHFWAYLNWALGLRQAGCEVVWLEHADPSLPAEKLSKLVLLLKEKLARYGRHEALALCSHSLSELSSDFTDDVIPLAAIEEADLFLNMAYASSELVVKRFRRSALLDIDPGLLQAWMKEGALRLPTHHCHFTIGEGIARKNHGGREWIYTPPCIALDFWPVLPANEESSFTTVTHWGADEWFAFEDEAFPNDKRTGFLPYLDLPRRVSAPLELALCFAADDKLEPLAREKEECAQLQAKGWKIVHSYLVSKTPWEYQSYIQRSRGEFSCAKPAFVRLQTGWISDRTICYLASGRPAIVQHTGPSDFSFQGDGLLRFRDPEEAATAIEMVASDYARHSYHARRLAEEYFAAARVVPRLLDRALDKRRAKYFLPTRPKPQTRARELITC